MDVYNGEYKAFPTGLMERKLDSSGYLKAYGFKGTGIRCVDPLLTLKLDKKLSLLAHRIRRRGIDYVFKIIKVRPNKRDIVERLIRIFSEMTNRMGIITIQHGYTMHISSCIARHEDMERFLLTSCQMDFKKQVLIMIRDHLKPSAKQIFKTIVYTIITKKTKQKPPDIDDLLNYDEALFEILSGYLQVCRKEGFVQCRFTRSFQHEALFILFRVLGANINKCVQKMP